MTGDVDSLQDRECAGDVGVVDVAQHHANADDGCSGICCRKRYTRLRLQSSMGFGLLGLYHVYWILAAMVIGSALGINLLLTWFIEWFQYTAGGGIQGLQYQKYLAVLLRSCLLIRLLSHFFRIGVWLLQDAMRLEGFQVYRCMLCGGAAREMIKGNPDIIRELSTAGGWRYKDSCTGKLDVILQLMIYFSFDVLPLTMAISDFVANGDYSSATSTLAIWASGMAMAHVIIFHVAETANDIYSKVAAWSAFSSKIKLRSQRQRNAPDSVGSPLVPTAVSHTFTSTSVRSRTISMTEVPPQQEETPQAVPEESYPPTDTFTLNTAYEIDEDSPSQSAVSSEFHDRARGRPVESSVERPIGSSVESSSVERAGTVQLPPVCRDETQASFASDVSSELGQTLRWDAELGVDAPWNVCLLFCNCLQSLGEVILALVACGLYVLGIWQLCGDGDYSVVVVASLFILVIGLYRFRHVPKRCSKKLGENVSHEPPPRMARRWRRFWRWAAEAQRWGDTHCGFAEEHAAIQYELLALISLMQGLLFVYIQWWDGVWLMCILMFAQVVRRLTLSMVKPWGWLCGLLEAALNVAGATTLNGLLNGKWYAIGTFCMALGCQFSLGRYHLKSWRVLMWSTSILQVILVMIMSISMLAVLQDTSDFSNFCSADQPDCQYFSTSTLPYRSPQFCDISFPLSRMDDQAAEPRMEDRSTEPILTIPDFGLLSALAYEGNATYANSLQRWFPNWKISFQRRVDHIQPSSKDLHQDWTTFFELSDPRNTTTVFAIRGTSSPLEILQDFNIWCPIAVPQIISYFGPDLTTVSAKALLVLSNSIYGQWMQKAYYADLLAHVRAAIKADPGRRFYITGHSLGGGLAKIVTMETGVPSVTFSSPGLRSTRMLVNGDLNEENTVKQSGEAALLLHRESYTVVPDNDIVPQVDAQLGTQIRISCDQNPLGCHSLGETICELLSTCGANPHRPKSVNCALCPRHRHLFPECQRKSPEEGGLADSPYTLQV